MDYQTILTIKESKKAKVELAAVDGFVGPVIVKHLKGGKPEIYRILLEQKHPNIPEIYSVKELDGELLVVEEYVDGESLAELLQKKYIPDDIRINMALQLCEALEFLHNMKPMVIHRDVKPSNILVNDKWELRLLDFDASRQYKEEHNSSDTMLLGTVEYAPPEQFGFAQTDARSDIYSMGVVLHEMCPTEDKKLAEKWERIANKCTSFDPKDRFQSVEHLKKELEALVQWKKNYKYFPWVITGATIILIAAIICLCLWIAKENKKQDLNKETASNISEVEKTTNDDTETTSETATEPPTELPTEPTTLSETDLIVKDMVEQFEAEGSFVDKFSKGLVPARDYMFYTTDFEMGKVIINYISMINTATNEVVVIPSEYFYMENNIVHIKNEYLKQLEIGCYNVSIGCYDVETSTGSEIRTCLWLREGLDRESYSPIIVNNCLDFYYEYISSVHTMLANETSGKLVATKDYEVMENGRVAKFDLEFLMQHIEPGTDGELEVTLYLEDGRSQNVIIAYKTGKPWYMN